MVPFTSVNPDNFLQISVSYPPIFPNLNPSPMHRVPLPILIPYSPIRRVPKGLYGFPIICSIRLQAAPPLSVEFSPIRRVPKGLYGFPIICSLRLQAPIRRVPKGLYGFPIICSLRLQAASIKKPQFSSFCSNFSFHFFILFPESFRLFLVFSHPSTVDNNGTNVVTNRCINI